MANVLDRQIVESGPVNAVVKLTGVLDTADVSLAPAVELTDFDDTFPGRSLSGFRVMKVDYSIADGLQVLIAWDGTPAQQIAAVSGRGKVDACHYGGFRPDEDVTNYSGSINLSTAGYVADTTQNFTVVLTLKKIWAN